MWISTAKRKLSSVQTKWLPRCITDLSYGCHLSQCWTPPRMQTKSAFSLLHHAVDIHTLPAPKFHVLWHLRTHIVQNWRKTIQSNRISASMHLYRIFCCDDWTTAIVTCIESKHSASLRRSRKYYRHRLGVMQRRGLRWFNNKIVFFHA